MINATSPLLRAETLKQFCHLVAQGRHDTELSVIDEYAESFYEGTPL